MNVTLWVIQSLLALTFVLLGSVKAFMPADKLKEMSQLAKEMPVIQTRFIGISEILGAIGLIAPGVTGILPWLTIAAAVGLVIVLIGAVTVHIQRKEFSVLGLPVVLLLLAILLIAGRWMLVPLA